MLALTRKVGETILIGDRIRITIAAVEGDKVRIGIDAPKELTILRQELVDAVRDENKAAVTVNMEALTDIPKKISTANMTRQEE